MCGDILMSVRAPVGPVNIATEKCCIGRGLALIRAKEQVIQSYLFHVLKNKEKNITGNKGAAFDSITKKDIAVLKEPIDFTTVCKLAVEHSDGIIQQSPNANKEVLDYARSLGKPILEYQDTDDFADRCNRFYDLVTETE